MSIFRWVFGHFDSSDVTLRIPCLYALSSHIDLLSASSRFLLLYGDLRGLDRVAKADNPIGIRLHQHDMRDKSALNPW